MAHHVKSWDRVSIEKNALVFLSNVNLALAMQYLVALAQILA